MNELALCKEAVLTLASGSGDRIKQADNWLCDFERTTTAWLVADELAKTAAASDPNAKAYNFFGVKILYTKVKRDFHQLDNSSAQSLKQSLVNHLLRLGNSNKYESSLVRYFCLSLAALAVQLNEAGAVGQILQWLHPIIAVMPQVLLELLLVLPEECFNRHVDVGDSSRSQFAEQLAQTSPDTFRFLNYMATTITPSLSQPGSPAVESARLVLLCFEKWIENIHISSQLVQEQPIYLFVLGCLQHDELFPEAVGVLRVVLYKYQSTDMKLLQLTVPHILQLRSMWQRASAEAESDDDNLAICRSICKLYTELGESCVGLFAVDNESYGQNDILQQILECCSFSHDGEVRQFPLRFVYRFACFVKKSSDAEDYDEYGFKTEVKAELNPAEAATLTKYVPFFRYVLQAAINGMLLPPELISGSQSKLSDEQATSRMDWVDALKDCVDVLGAKECLSLVCAMLQGELAVQREATKWDRVESCLYAVQSISERLPNDDNEAVPQLMNIIGTLPDNLLGLRATVLYAVGTFAPWFNRHPNTLAHVFTVLTGALRTEQLVLAASKSIMRIFKKCAAYHEMPLAAVHALVLELRPSGVLSLKAETSLLEGFCDVLSAMQTKKAEQVSCLSVILEPLSVSITSTVNGCGGSKDRVSAAVMTSLLNDIDRVTTILRNVHADCDVMTRMFMLVQPTLQACLELSDSDRIAEKVCRCYKHTIRKCGPAFLPYLPALGAHLVERFQRTPLAAFLYAAAICVSSYGRDRAGGGCEVCVHMAAAMTNTFFVNLSSSHHFQQLPDVVEEYFYLMAAILKYCAQDFLLSISAETADRLAHAGICGLQIEHKMAQKGVLFFFERLVELPHADVSPEVAASAAHIVQKFGPALVDYIISNMSGQASSQYDLDDRHESIRDVLWHVKTLPGADMAGWLQSSLSKVPAWAQDEARNCGLVPVVCGGRGFAEFDATIEKFAFKCQRTNSSKA